VFGVLEPGRQDLAYASQSCFQERQPHYRAAHFLYLPAITVVSPKRNTIVGRERREHLAQLAWSGGGALIRAAASTQPFGGSGERSKEWYQGNE